MQSPELARDVYRRIQDKPDSFRMRSWAVLLGQGRYAACLAGHTLLASGYELAADDMFCSPGGSIISDPGEEAFLLLGLTRKEYRRGVHWWKCNIFCENAPEDAALDNFLQVIIEEEQSRPVLASLLR